MNQAQTLRSIMNKDKDLGIQVITVTSAKGGVGKSSVALNLAIALNRRGKRALIVDMDFGLANIDVMLGVKTKYDLLNVVRDHKDIREVIESGLHGVQFISGGSGLDELVRLNSQQLQRIIGNLLHLEDIADILIFDTGAGITDNILRLIYASHETLLVTTPEPTAIMDAYALVKIISKHHVKPNIRLILNKAESEREAHAAISGFISIAKKYTDMQVEELGYILKDENMVKAVKQQVPLLVSYPKCNAAAGLERLTGRFLSGREEGRGGFTGFLERLLSAKI